MVKPKIMLIVTLLLANTFCLGMKRQQDFPEESSKKTKINTSEEKLQKTKQKFPPNTYFSSLAEAMIAQDIPTVKKMIEQSSDIKTAIKLPNSTIYSALSLAIMLNNSTYITTLIDHGADTTIAITNPNGSTNSALGQAIEKNHLETLNLLLNKKASTKNALVTKDGASYSALGLAIQMNKPDIVELILQYDSDFTQPAAIKQNQKEYSALHLAIYKKNLEIITLLRDHGHHANAIFTAPDRTIYSALGVALISGSNLNLNVIKFLIDENTDILRVAQYPDDSYDSALTLALTLNSDKKLINFLVLITPKNYLLEVAQYPTLFENLPQEHKIFISWLLENPNLEQAPDNVIQQFAQEYTDIAFTLPAFFIEFKQLLWHLDASNYTKTFTKEIIADALMARNIKAFELLIPKLVDTNNSELLKLIKSEITVFLQDKNFIYQQKDFEFTDAVKKIINKAEQDIRLMSSSKFSDTICK